MTIIEKLFALKSHPLFRRLEDSELILISEIAISKSYPRGKLIAREGTVLGSVQIVVEGEVLNESSGLAHFPFFGGRSVVFESVLEDSLRTGDSGAVCLKISKGHFFTIINECPRILVEYLRLVTQREGDPQVAEPNRGDV